MPQPPKPMTLYTVGEARPADACIRAHLVPAGIKSATALDRVFCHKNALDAIHEAQRSGRPFAVAQASGEEEPLVLPATISIHFRPMGEDGEDVLVFAGPRPSPLRIARGDTKMLHLVQQAQQSGQGVVFAVTGAFWATDAALIPLEDAKRLLGFKAQPH